MFFIHKIIQLTMTKEKEVQIIEPGGGKHMMISGDVNSILLAKNQTNGTYGIVEGRIYPGGGPPPIFKLGNMRNFMYWMENLLLMLKENK